MTDGQTPIASLVEAPEAEAGADPARFGFHAVSRWVLDRPLPSEPAERLRADLVVGFALAFVVFGAFSLVSTQLVLPLPDDSVVLSAWTTATFMLGLIGALIALHLGAPVRFGAHVICGTTFLVVAASTIAHGGIASPVLILWAVLPQMAGILTGRRAAIAWAVLLVALAPAMHVAEAAGHLHVIPVSQDAWVPSLLVILATACGAAACMAVLHDRIQMGMREQLDAERKKLRHAAGHDPLTNVANRRLFEEMQTIALGRAARSKQHLVLFVLDLDGFKPINDAHGHAAGDDVLLAVAERLRGLTRITDAIARVGGDEFAILAEQIESPDAARAVAQRIEEALDVRLAMPDQSEVAVSFSIGAAIYPDDGETAAELNEAADLAMYSAKAAGGGRCCFYADCADR